MPNFKLAPHSSRLAAESRGYEVGPVEAATKRSHRQPSPIYRRGRSTSTNLFFKNVLIDTVHDERRKRRTRRLVLQTRANVRVLFIVHYGGCTLEQENSIHIMHDAFFFADFCSRCNSCGLWVVRDNTCVVGVHHAPHGPSHAVNGSSFPPTPILPELSQIPYDYDAFVENATYEPVQADFIFYFCTSRKITPFWGDIC